MDYFSRKPDFPTFEDIYIACAQGAIGLERREDGLACRFGQDGPAIMLPQVTSQGDGVRGRAVCDGIAGALKEDPGVRAAAAGCLDSYFTEVAGRAPVGETCGSDCLFACHVDIDGVYAQRTGDPDGFAPTATPLGSAGTTARSITSRMSPSSRSSGSCARTGTTSPSCSTGRTSSRPSTARRCICRRPSRWMASGYGPAATTSAGARPSPPISAAPGALPRRHRGRLGGRRGA